MDLDPNRTALVVIDMQKDFCHPDGVLHAPGSEAAIGPIASLLERARAADLQVVFTRDVHPPDQFENAYYADEFERWGEHVLEGSWGAELLEELSVQDGDRVVEKRTYDAFHDTDLAQFLEERGIRDLLFVGTLANVCVLRTAGSAALRDFRPILVEDAVGYVDPDHRDYALTHADWVFGEVASRNEITFR